MDQTECWKIKHEIAYIRRLTERFFVRVMVSSDYHIFRSSEHNSWTYRMDSSNTGRFFSKSDTVIRRYPRTSVILCNREMKRSQYVRQRFLPNQVRTERPKAIGFSSTKLHDTL